MNDAANEVLKPGYPGTRCIKVPNEWIMDGMEVFSGRLDRKCETAGACDRRRLRNAD